MKTNAAGMPLLAGLGFLHQHLVLHDSGSIGSSSNSLWSGGFARGEGSGGSDETLAGWPFLSSGCGSGGDGVGCGSGIGGNLACFLRFLQFGPAALSSTALGFASVEHTETAVDHYKQHNEHSKNASDEKITDSAERADWIAEEKVLVRYTRHQSVVRVDAHLQFVHVFSLNFFLELFEQKETVWDSLVVATINPACITKIPNQCVCLGNTVHYHPKMCVVGERKTWRRENISPSHLPWALIYLRNFSFHVVVRNSLKVKNSPFKFGVVGNGHPVRGDHFETMMKMVLGIAPVMLL